MTDTFATYAKRHNRQEIVCDVTYAEGAGTITLSAVINDERVYKTIEQLGDDYRVLEQNCVTTYDTLGEAIKDVLHEIEGRIDDALMSKHCFMTNAVEALDELGFVDVKR